MKKQLLHRFKRANETPRKPHQARVETSSFQGSADSYCRGPARHPKTMTRYLTKAGYQTDFSGNGRDAWRRFQELSTNGHRPALVIADLGLPDIDGRTLCRKIKDSSPRLPVLLTSGHVVALDPSKKRTTEGIPFIQKPFDASMLLRTINDLIQRRL